MARGSLLSLVGAAVTTVATFLVTLIVTRTMSRTDAGVFFAASTLFLLAQTVGRLGTDTSLVYFLARYRAMTRAERIGATLRTALVATTVAALVIGIALFVTAPYTVGVLLRGGHGNFVTLCRILLVMLPIAVISDTVLAATRGYSTMRPTVLAEKIGRPALQLALVAVAASFGNVWLTAAWVLPYLPAMLLGCWWLRNLYRANVAAVPAPVPATTTAVVHGSASALPSVRQEFWRFTTPRAAASVMQTALQRIDILLVAGLAGPVAAAIYTAATRFLVVGQMVNQAISLPVQPRLSTVLAKGDVAGAKSIYQLSTAWLVMLTWPFYLALSVWTPYALRLFGRGYGSGAGVSVLLALTMLLAMSTGFVDIVLIMVGRTTWNLANVAVALAINLAVDLALISRIGILGAAIGWAAAIVCKNVLPLVQVARTTRLHPFGIATVTVAGLAAACFGALPWLVSALTAGAAPLLGATTAGAVIYVLGCWRWRSMLHLDGLRGLRRRIGPAADRVGVDTRLT